MNLNQNGKFKKKMLIYENKLQNLLAFNQY